MNFAAFHHEPKSRMSYACDGKTIHVRVKTAKNDAARVSVRAVDPFNWRPAKEGSREYVFAVETIREIPMVKEATTDFHDIWFASISEFVWARIRYGFVIENHTERYFFGCHYTADLSGKEEEKDNVSNYFNFPYINEEDIYKAPDWVKHTIWYQIFPYSFCADGSECTRERHGTLKGVLDRLDYLQDLGINGIYFTPIFLSPSDHKYDTTDYFRVDDTFGTNETFGQLVEEAHKRGIKIMLDAVFNHCGYEHPFWQDVLKKGKNSEYYDCFYIVDHDKAPDDLIEVDGAERCNYRTFGFTPTMPKWNTSHPVVREHLLQAAVYWAQQFHIDGWRLDVSNEVSHDFWREFRKRIKAVNPDIYILGENWDDSMPWLEGDQFDAVMNYEFMGPVWNFIGTMPVGKERKRAGNATQFQNDMNELMISYPRPLTSVMFNLLESHDTSRLMTVCENIVEAAKLAYVIQMTFAGCPSIYYGGEIGMAGAEGDNRRPMTWHISDSQRALKEHIRRLIHIRKQDPCLESVETAWHCADNDTGTVIYEKTCEGRSVYVILHNRNAVDKIELPESLRNRECTDIYREKRIVFDTELVLYPYEFYIVEA